MSTGERYAQILIPFWGLPASEVGKPTSGRYDELAARGSEVLEFVSLQECEVAIYPGESGDWGKMMANARRMISESASAQKKVIIFFLSDSAEPLEVGESIIFRTSMYRSLRSPNEYAMPAWSEDFVKKYWNSQLPIRQKRKTPVVGFCGQPGPLKYHQRFAAVASKVRSYLSSRFSSRANEKYHTQKSAEGPFHGLVPSYTRTKALSRLLHATGIETKFRFKRGHFGGSLDRNGNIQEDVAHLARKDLLENMIESDYIVCARGGGNFSYRLYETLSAGRVPVFVDSDCVLPFDDILPWREFCIWINENDLDNIAEYIKDFHASKSPSDFIALQHTCRNIWEDWLSPLGFFSNIHAHLRNISRDSR